MIVNASLVVVVVVFGLLFVAVGVLCLWSLVSLLRSRWGASADARHSAGWVATTGRVTRALVTYTSGRRGRIYRPTIHFAYRVGDVDHVSERFAFVEPTGEESDARELVARFHEGAEVTVYYDPKRPEQATLDRRAPPVIGFTIGWSLLLLLFGAVATAIGFDIVVGAFEEPPLDPSEVPSMHAQLGGVVTGLGVLALLIAGVRSLRAEARTQSRLLGLLASAKPARAGQVRHGERVMVVGRAEALPADEDSPSLFEFPFERGPILFYDVKYGPYSERAVVPFVVRDETGAIEVWIDSVETAMRARTVVRGDVERWLQDKYREEGDSVPAGLTPVNVEWIREGDTVLVVADAEHDEDEDAMVLRAREASLLGDTTREELVQRLGKRGRTTRVLGLLGIGLAIAGAILMVV